MRRALHSKTFKSESQYEQHLQSKKHKVTEAEYAAAPPKPAAAAKPQSSATAAAAAASSSASAAAGAAKADAVFGDIDDADGEDEDEDGYDSDEDASKALPVTACLFCSHQSASLAENVQHMTDAHSFFVPYVEYLQDLEGFIQVGN